MLNISSIAGIGIIVGMWNTLKLWVSKFISVFVITVEIRSCELSNAIKYELVHNFSRSPLGTKNVRGHNEYVRVTNQNQLVAFDVISSEPTVWWEKWWKPILVNSNDNDQISIKFCRWNYNYQDFVKRCVDHYNDFSKKINKNDRFYIRKVSGSIGQSNLPYDNKVQTSSQTSSQTDVDKKCSFPIGWTRDEIGQPKRKSPFDSIYLREHQLKAIEEAKYWKKSEKWFKDRSVPWKRGWLLYGKPGTGKSFFVRCLSQELNVPIISFDLATMTNQDFLEKWNDVLNSSPCICLFEDFDAVFNGRINIAINGKNNVGITFDCFLNCLDGIENTDGLFTIITTNHIEKLDDAVGVLNNGDGISSRPGRIDKIILFKELDQDCKYNMAKRILGDFDEMHWKHLLNDGKEYTGACFQEKCCQLALKLFWEATKNEDG